MAARREQKRQEERGDAERPEEDEADGDELVVGVFRPLALDPEVGVPGAEGGAWGGQLMADRGECGAELSGEVERGRIHDGWVEVRIARVHVRWRTGRSD